MIIAGEYSFNGGLEFVRKHHGNLLEEVFEIIERVDASVCKTKTSKEKTMPGRKLFSPPALNKCFKTEF